MARRFAGAFYLLPLARMDAIKHDARSLLQTAYARNQPRQRYPRVEPFHVSWAFDVAVIVALLIAVVGFITA